MNDHEQFEKRLQRQPLREVPRTWREEILLTARNAGSSRHASPAARRSLVSTFSQLLSTLLWPHPRAWAGLAAVWVLMCAIHFANRQDPTAASGAVPESPRMREMLREQEQLLAELFDQPLAADRTKVGLPRPQSFYRSQFLTL